jgi:hypothetical protein
MCVEFFCKTAVFRGRNQVVSLFTACSLWELLQGSWRIYEWCTYQKGFHLYYWKHAFWLCRWFFLVCFESLVRPFHLLVRFFLIYFYDWEYSEAILKSNLVCTLAKLPLLEDFRNNLSSRDRHKPLSNWQKTRLKRQKFYLKAHPEVFETTFLPNLTW